MERRHDKNPVKKNIEGKGGKDEKTKDEDRERQH